jgi:UDP-glucose 4-epimerase
MIRRALVTGGAGFIGSHVVEALRGAKYDVTVLDDLSSGKRENIPEGVEFLELDIRSIEAIDAIRDGGYSLIVHLGAQIDVRKSVADPVYDATVNIVGTLNVLNGAQRSGENPRVVFTSTGGALYGALARIPNEEEQRKEPDSPYGVSKLTAEYYIACYSRLHGSDAVVLRFGNVYGPRQDPHGEAGVVSIFCGRIVSGAPLTVYGDGLQTRDYIYVGDVARAVLSAARVKELRAGGLDTRAFNIGTGVGTSVIELARLLQDAAGTSLPLEFAPPRPGEQQASVLDVSKARKELHWTARVPLKEGLRKTYEWYTAGSPSTSH